MDPMYLERSLMMAWTCIALRLYGSDGRFVPRLVDESTKCIATVSVSIMQCPLIILSQSGKVALWITVSRRCSGPARLPGRFLAESLEKIVEASTRAVVYSRISGHVYNRKVDVSDGDGE